MDKIPVKINDDLILALFETQTDKIIELSNFQNEVLDIWRSHKYPEDIESDIHDLLEKYDLIWS